MGRPLVLMAGVLRTGMLNSNNLCRVGTTGCGLKPLNACCLEKATTTFKGGQLYLKDVFQPQSLKAWDGQK